MRHAVFALFLGFFLAACATQGQRGAEIEQRDLYDQGQQQQRAAQEAQARAEAEKQAQILREQEELKRQLEEQQRRQAQTGQIPGEEQPVIRPITGTAVGETQLKGDPWTQLKEPGTLLTQRSVYYDFDRYDIREEYVPLIEAHSKFLVDNNNLKIVVQGNCDERGSREYNLALGQRRADSVKRAMLLLGVGDKQIETVSFGAEKPVALGQDEESWAKNRRSDIVYLNEPGQ
jgi:peptidoglycan-associated lipoprotein